MTGVVITAHVDLTPKLHNFFIFIFGKRDETGQPSKAVTCTLWKTDMGLKICIYYLASLNRNLQESWIHQ